MGDFTRVSPFDGGTRSILQELYDYLDDWFAQRRQKIGFCMRGDNFIRAEAVRVAKLNFGREDGQSKGKEKSFILDINKETDSCEKQIQTSSKRKT